MKKQTLFEELRSQFFVKNKGRLAVAALASVLGGTIGLMASWVLKTLTDTISGAEGALSLVQNLDEVSTPAIVFGVNAKTIDEGVQFGKFCLRAF